MAAVQRRTTPDLTQRRFGRWIALKQMTSRGGGWRWLCRCDCGGEGKPSGYDLLKGKSTSCGCLRTEQVVARTMTHGQSRRSGKTSEYECWRGIIKRCENESADGYADYGGRGIKVCQRWRESFAAFFADMGPKPTPYHEIDRIDVNGDYEPGNCRWATPVQNARNKRSNRLITAFGETLTMAEWAERRGMRYITLYNRLARGATPEDALTWPLGVKHKRRSK